MANNTYEYKLGVGDLTGKLFRRSRENDVVSYAELDGDIPPQQGTFIVPGPWTTWGFVSPAVMDALWDDLRMFSHDPVKLVGSQVLPQPVEVSYRVRVKPVKPYRRTGDRLEHMHDGKIWVDSKEDYKLLPEWDNPTVFYPYAISTDAPAPVAGRTSPSSPQLRAVEHTAVLDIRVVEQSSIVPVSWDDLPVNHLFRTCDSATNGVSSIAYVKTSATHFIANGYRSLSIHTGPDTTPYFVDLGPAEYSFSKGMFRVRQPGHGGQPFANGMPLPLGTVYRAATGHVWIRALNGAVSIADDGTFLVADEDDAASATGTIIGQAFVTVGGDLKFNP